MLLMTYSDTEKSILYQEEIYEGGISAHFDIYISEERT